MLLDPQELRREKRVRFSIRTPLAVSPERGGTREEVSTIDLSASGLRVRLSRPISPGEIVEVFLNKRPERCRVVWTSSPGGARDLIAGLEFVTPLPEPSKPSASV